MDRITMKKAKPILSVFLSFCMIISCMVGMSVTASASLYEDATWSENQHFTTNAELGAVTVSADITVTIDENVTVTVNKGINAEGKTLTVEGKGTLVVNGTNGTNGTNGSNGGAGGNGSDGGDGIIGNVIVNGATVTVTGGSGGKGGKGGDGSSSGGNGGNGGSGGNGIEGDLTVNSGSATVTGGSGGNGGNGGYNEEYGPRDGGNGGNGGRGVDGNVTVTDGTATVTGGSGSGGGSGRNVGGNGRIGSAVSGTITGSVQESDDNSNWSAVSGTSSTKQYVKITPAVLAWTNGNVTATLSGTKLTVEKTEGAENGDMGNNGWTKVGSAAEWSTKRGTITEIEIKDGVTSIGQNAFIYCSSLATVTIPTGVTSIGDLAFGGCTALTSITIPNSVTSIGLQAFAACNSLSSIIFERPTANSSLSVSSNVFCNVTVTPSYNISPSTAAIAYSGTGSYALFDGDTEITTDKKAGDLNNKTLTWKVPPYQWTNGNVTATLDGTKLTVEKTENAENGNMGIGWAPVGSAPAWSSIRGTITEVEIKDGVTRIRGFSACAALTSVTIPDSVTRIMDGAFSGCKALTSVTIPGGVTDIGRHAFDNCNNLTSVTFERPAAADTGLSIGEEAFTFLINGSYSPSTAAISYSGDGNLALFDGDTEITTDNKAGDLNNKSLTWKVPAPEDIDISEGTVIADTLFETVTVIVDGEIVPEDAYHVIYFTYEKIEGGESVTRVGTSFPTAAGTYIAAVVANENSGYTGENRSDPFTVSAPDNSYIYGYGPYVQTQTVTTTTTPAPAVTPTPAATSSVKMWAVQNADKSSITVSWDKVSGATKYTLYVRKNGKLEKVVETKKTKVLIKNVANNTDLEYVLKYTINGVESAENSAYTASIKVNYKPAVKLTANKGSVMVKWSKVPEATKYRVYKYANGKLTLITETAKSAVRVTGTKAGSKYSYAVKALVNGEWTKIYSSDIATVTAK